MSYFEKEEGELCTVLFLPVVFLFDQYGHQFDEFYFAIAKCHVFVSCLKALVKASVSLMYDNRQVRPPGRHDCFMPGH